MSNFELHTSNVHVATESPEVRFLDAINSLQLTHLNRKALVDGYCLTASYQNSYIYTMLLQFDHLPVSGSNPLRTSTAQLSEVPA